MRGSERRNKNRKSDTDTLSEGAQSLRADLLTRDGKIELCIKYFLVRLFGQIFDQTIKLYYWWFFIKHTEGKRWMMSFNLPPVARTPFSRRKTEKKGNEEDKNVNNSEFLRMKFAVNRSTLTDNDDFRAHASQQIHRNYFCRLSSSLSALSQSSNLLERRTFCRFIEEIWRTLAECC